MRYLGLVLFMTLTPCACIAQNSKQYGACGDKAKTQTEMNACANEEATRVDAELNRIYAQLLSKAKDDPEAAAKIKAAERA